MAEPPEKLFLEIHHLYRFRGFTLHSLSIKHTVSRHLYCCPQHVPLVLLPSIIQARHHKKYRAGQM